jgi:hypothetical protein
MLKVADGPDEVHKMVIARRELNHWAKEAEGEGSVAATDTVDSGSTEPAPART